MWTRALALVLFAVACAHPESAPIVERRSPPIAEQPRCTDAAAVRLMLEEFIGAVNRGHADEILAYLSPAFLWYSDATVVAYGREEAARVLAQRAANGERLSLVDVTVNTLDGWDGAAQFGPIVLELTDADGARRAGGKGALYCDGRWRGIEVLSLAGG